MTENQWRHDVLRLARQYGWSHYYTHYSPYSTPGWPDLTLVKPPLVVVAELKAKRGRLRPEQATARDLLAQCERVEYHLWRPDDLDDVVAVLTDGRGRAV
jgi:hypothetical protein